MFWSVLLWIICGFFLLLTIAIIRTLLIPNQKSTYTAPRDPQREEKYAQILSAMVAQETVSQKGQSDLSKFYAFHDLLEKLFPNIHRVCQKIEIDGNLLFVWKGKSGEKPILLMSHHDVVEASGQWEHPAFSGAIADDRIWGRGSCDTKSSLMALLQACEELIETGFTPNCDVYLASSCTEEISGDGGPKIVQYLKDHHIHLSMLSDEGGALTADPIPGVKGYFAMVGIFEKGCANVKFTAKSKGGHASAPPKNTPLARLAAFVNHIETKKVFRVKFTAPVRAMFTRLAPYCAFPLKLIFGNLWLFEPLLKVLLPKLSPQAAAMLKTTIVFTMAQGSNGQNVIPEAASVQCNMRFIPHQAKEESFAILEKLCKKYGLEMEIQFADNPSPSLDLQGEAYALTEKAVQAVFKGSACVPYVVTGATDARFYHEVADACVRFAPVLYDPQQLKSMHGLNENVYTYALPPAVDYYKFIVQNQ